jgi:hypothetical protein
MYGYPDKFNHMCGVSDVCADLFSNFSVDSNGLSELLPYPLLKTLERLLQLACNTLLEIAIWLNKTLKSPNH